MPQTNGLRAAIEALGGNLEDWTVLSPQSDPFRLDTPKNHREAKWLANAMAELGVTGRIHNRGLHYVLLRRPKPDGRPYFTTATTQEECEKGWNWLEGVSKVARWLDYVDWEQIKDERNAEPVFRLWTPPQPEICFPDSEIYFPDDLTDDLTPKATLDDFRGTQSYHLAIIGEKASLDDVLGPIAEEYEADLYLPTGNISNTRIHDLAANAAADDRPLVTLYFADCDPSGWNMPIEVARKLQALKIEKYPNLEFQCRRVGLTPKQVKAFKAAEQPLPESPVKETDKRAPKWERKMKVGQVEIDVLATLQPDLLRDMAVDAIEGLFYDTTLARRVAAVRRDWERRAQAVIDEQTDTAALDDAIAQIERKREEIEAILDTIRRDSDDFDLPPVPEIPAALPDLAALAAQPLPLFDSEWNFDTQTEMLIFSRDYELDNE